MTSDGWLDLVERLVRERLEFVEFSSFDGKTATFALAHRGAVVFFSDDVAVVRPNLAGGGTIASRLQDKVQHMDGWSFALNEVDAVAAADAIARHLR
jgi:hypothetical protein